MKKQAFTHVQVRLAKTYIKGLMSLRQTVFLVSLLGLSVLLFILAIGCLITGLMIWLPWDIQTKALILIGIGSAGVLTALFIAQFAYSERRWMQIFGVDKMLALILKEQD